MKLYLPIQHENDSFQGSPIDSPLDDAHGLRHALPAYKSVMWVVEYELTEVRRMTVEEFLSQNDSQS